jgi:hypothetical protein
MEIHIVNLHITLTVTQEKAEYFLEELSRDPIYSDLIFLFLTLFFIFGLLSGNLTPIYLKFHD